MDIHSYVTFSNWIKVFSPKRLGFLPLLIRPTSLYTQAFQLGILLTFVNTFPF